MKFVLASGVLGLVLALMVGCEKNKGGGESNAANAGTGDPRLDGTWTLIASEYKGRTAEETPGKEQTYTFSGDKMIHPKGKIEDAETIKCDPSKSPVEIDRYRTEANGKVDKFYGIYKIDGDKLTICTVKSDNPADRPNEFKTTPETNFLIQVFRKNK